MILREGQELLKTYIVERFLGEGAFAEVYRVRHRFMGRQAMKVFKNPSMTEDEINEVLSEARLLSQLHHRNIVRVFDAGVLQGEFGSFGYFTMEYMIDGTLYDYWQSQQAYLLPVELSVDFSRQISCALALAHSENPPIIHRDIKPHNILVGTDSASKLRVCLSDFGLAKQVKTAELIISGKGTIGFKPPEFFISQTDNMTSDVWAVGITAYLLLTNRYPFPMEEERWFIRQRWEEGFLPPSQYNLNVDGELDRIISKCLAANVAQRYANGGELYSDLTAWRTVSPEPEENILTAEEPLRDKELIERELQKIMELAEDSESLPQAAEDLRQLCTMFPELKSQYAGRIDLWQRGIKM